MGRRWRCKSEAYSDEDVHSTDECVAKPHQAIDKVEERQQEGHVLHASGSDYHPLHVP